MDKPTIGRIVHYTNLGDRDGKYLPETQASIVTGVNPDGSVALHVFYRTGGFDMASVPYGGAALASGERGRARDMGARGTWTWPERAK